MALTVDFTTNCYENDWRMVLGEKYLRTVVGRCSYPFSSRRLIINNVKERGIVETAAKAAIDRGDIDEYLFEEDHAAAALEFFQIDKASFGRGYLYSISELVAIYASSAAYLLYYMGDSFPKRRHHWIVPALALMESSADLVVANPCWNDRFKEAKKESQGQIDDFFVGYGFSDQCFLGKMSVFRAPVYGEKNHASERYPAYADEPFEKRFDAYMRNHGLKRLTHRSESYIHQNMPKAGLKRAWREIRPFVSPWL
ncbi:hypothetical protein LGH82_25570 [Mesorhizobium sp. PAMC28654]|uniref:hypothetical protein n=1 Tax=Mesorhizobium sp. PAMC28654 TaxID=2880934 RepID=UPI001D09CA94|nr:hypothetical protein [Mesorhizobium sp. PAMC28654]UDL88469.1 hypothetical protein LGH82_25570 [Mesorhizobium sp. PAMC28654]